MIKPLLWICATPLFALDILFYLLSFAWLRPKKPRGLQSVEHGSGKGRLGTPRRSAMQPHTLETGEFASIFEMVQASITKYGDSVAMVSRKFVELKKLKEKDRFPTKIFDDTQLDEVTYKQLNENLLSFGAGLRSVGMEPIPELKKGESFDDLKAPFVMVMFEDTCKEWTIAMQGAMSQSIVVATCYATLGEEAVVHAVNQTQATALFLNWKNAEKFAKMASSMPSLKIIIASPHEQPRSPQLLKAPTDSGIKIISYNDIIDLGQRKRESYAPVPPKSSDLACIMFTSGTTGKPKGVLMRHSQLVAGISGMVMNVQLRPGKETFVSYLPLAHILALQVEHVLLGNGAKLCYSDPRQLAVALPMFKPTIFAGVPAVWDRLMNALKAKLARKPVFKAVFDALLKWKLFAKKYIVDDTRATNWFFRLISKKLFGGALRFGITGGGPASPLLQDECRAVFCCPLVQGYALTETCVGGCFQALDDTRTGVVGPPVPCVEVCLQSEPDLQDSDGIPYMNTDRKSAKGEPILGRGEICLRGPSISSGYYKLPDKTKQEFDEDGWFHTGDVGQFTHDGVLQIIDRKKNLVKLRGGEYVAVESMEIAFGQSPFASAVCVLAHGDLDAPFVIVSVDREHLSKWSKETKLDTSSMETLLQSEEAREAVRKSLVMSGQDAGLSKLEQRIKDCCLVDKEWLPGSGMTASMKLDRKKIYSMHKTELAAMLKRNGTETEILQ